MGRLRTTQCRPPFRSQCSPLSRPLASAGVGGGFDVDLFVIVGQSNAEGRGNSALSPDATASGIYYDGSVFSALADPVGGATTGSMWPAFSNEWFAQTGRKSVFVEAATGGTALLPDTAGSNWSPSGTLRGAAVTAANNAIAAINSEPSYRLNSVYFVWAQGEQDAVTINGTTVTGPLYEAALEALADYFKAQVPEMVQMAVVQTGGEFDQTDEANYAAIRLAQENACADNANLGMAYRGAYSFTARALMGDNVHYAQAGLNIAGPCAVRGLLAPESQPTAPAVLAATAYPDTSYSTATQTRTANHTTAVGTKAIILAVSAMRPESNNSMTLAAPTFNGVAFTRVRDDKASANATTAGRVNCAIWILTESAYGSSLSGVTAPIVCGITTALNVNLIEWCAFDCDVECVAEDWRFDAATPANKDTGSVSGYTNAPSLVIGAAASAASTASPLTCSFTNMTEAMDSSQVNPALTRSGQMAVGYAVESAIVTGKTYSAQFSATCTALSFVVAAFRKKYLGEP